MGKTEDVVWAVMSDQPGLLWAMGGPSTQDWEKMFGVDAESRLKKQLAEQDKKLKILQGAVTRTDAALKAQNTTIAKLQGEVAKLREANQEFADNEVIDEIGRKAREAIIRTRLIDPGIMTLDDVNDDLLEHENRLRVLRGLATISEL